MLKKLFRRLAGGRAQPKIVFTCRGINSELIINTSILQFPADILRPLCSLPGAKITPTGWRTWRVTATGPTGTLAVIHNITLRNRGNHEKN
ncbi:hypothetical protein [Enterobacter mori]|uniref:hypothetical protein n=1 Tax=Enterobacter mori TaxID=539813 RepID=UPI003B83E3E2